MSNILQHLLTLVRLILISTLKSKDVLLTFVYAVLTITAIFII